MWRTVIVNRGERITTKDNWLVISADGKEQRVPIADIYSVVLDNRDAVISIFALTALTDAGANILFCDEKHVPVSVTIPLNSHYKPLAVIRKQLLISQEFKDFLWERIVRAKINNQIKCLKLVGVKREKIEALEDLRRKSSQEIRQTERVQLHENIFCLCLAVALQEVMMM